MGFSCSVKAVLFDCDGTLIDSEPAHFEAWQYALSRKGFHLKAEAYLGKFSGVADSDVADMAVKLLGEDCAGELLRVKDARFAETLKNGLPAIRPTIDFVHRLAQYRDEGEIKLGVASAARRDDILANLEHHAISHLFDVVLSGTDDLHDFHDAEGTNKPKPYIYLKAAALLLLPPEECAAIEDSFSGVTAAVAAGCITVAVPNTHTTTHDLSAAHHRIASFNNLTVDEFLRTLTVKSSTASAATSR